jgi:coproporphyrinogen III oxidase
MPRVKELFTEYIHQLQDTICTALERADGKAKFREDAWMRDGGGGGKTRVITEGNVFVKGGVNTSVVYGALPESMQQAFNVKGADFFACGISLVLHPENPYVPTVHANWRYFELYNEAGEIIDSWFGGGADLTPYYIFKEDGKYFHTVFKNVLDNLDSTLYPAYKKNCDEYFVNKHRNNEARGIGGIFYDYLRPDEKRDSMWYLNHQQQIGNAFLEAYLPIVEARKNIPYGECEKEWQEIRRGRYVEFNLVHDRGTLFGLKTNGRTESILMSLPPRARWEYDYTPQAGSKEAELLDYLKPRDWVNI